MSHRTVGFDLSGVGVCIRDLAGDLADRLEEDWRAFAAAPTDSPRLDVTVEVIGRAYSETVYSPKAMRSSLSPSAAWFGMPEGEVGVAPNGVATIRLVAGLGDVAYYTLRNLIRASLAWVLPSGGAGLVHAAGLVLDGRAFVLVGAEGAGKSTWARLGESAGGLVVSDDLVLIDAGVDPPALIGTPFRSTHVAQYGPGRWPLAAILFPRHGAEPALGPASAPLLSQARLTANLPFVADGIEDDPRIADFVRRLAFEVPCRELTFAPDPGFAELLRGWPARSR